MSTNIALEGETPVDPDSSDTGWWIDGRVVTVRDDAFIASYRLPKSPVVTLLRLGNGRARLGLASYARTSLTVTGPRAAIENLREAVL